MLFRVNLQSVWFLVAWLAGAPVLAEPPAAPDPLALFGYSVKPGGNSENVYARKRLDGSVAELSEAEMRKLRPQWERFLKDNPNTALAWKNCPAITAHVSERLERGADYQGGKEGDNAHPHAQGKKFWSGEPFYDGKDQEGRPVHWGDPVDGSVLFVLELENAARAEDYQRIWSAALKAYQKLKDDRKLDDAAKRKAWEELRDEWILNEAKLKAESTVVAVELIERNADGLSLRVNLEEGYGRSYRVYAGWIKEARKPGGGVDAAAVRDAILANSGTYKDNPADKGETYRQRLRKLFAQAMPPVP